jgi:hypothetical protein
MGAAGTKSDQTLREIMFSMFVCLLDETGLSGIYFFVSFTVSKWPV